MTYARTSPLALHIAAATPRRKRWRCPHVLLMLAEAATLAGGMLGMAAWVLLAAAIFGG